MALVGDIDHWRVWCCIVVTSGAAAVIYLGALPEVLPTWPAVVAVAVGAVVGMVWEERSGAA
jgi:hypothetical protein